ncbi:MAG: zinc-dependent alcohol dehydrogenase family protein [Thermoanaerobaculia bacterium]|nr:zinc-dependent alcohol dehydrogenase family protein [Thermoanaerobaculia bacterium]
MKALVYHGPGRRSWDDKPEPTIEQPTGAIVKIFRTTICGTDLHILKGDVPTVTDGRTLGHEGVGVVTAVGTAVSVFAVGDHVLISCITSCGKCASCRRGMTSHCEQGGWILGNTLDGTQADFVRIPFADTSLYAVPPGADEDALVMLSDILPTGFECGVLKGQVKPGDTLAIVGAGPIGLAVLMTAQFYAPSEVIVIDLDDHRLEVARDFGATRTINSGSGDAALQVLAATGGKGVDVAVEAVGLPATFELCQDILAPGGHLANVGVHGRAVELKLQKLWSHNVTITTQLVDTTTIPLLLRSVVSGRLQARKLITHEFLLGDLMKAYDAFGNAGKEKALKVLVRAG